MRLLILANRARLSRLMPLTLCAMLSCTSSTWAQGAASAGRLQSLVNDTAAQLRLSYRQDPHELQLRREEVGRAIAGWNKSARGEADNERLADWLRQAMRVSMPGSRESLPPLPEFLRPVPPAEKTPDISPSTTTTRSVTDSNSNSKPADASPTIMPQEPAARDSIIKSITNAPETSAESTPTTNKRDDAKTSDEKSAGDSHSFFEVTPMPAIQPATALPKSDAETDPFRDDPLPGGK